MDWIVNIWKMLIDWLQNGWNIMTEVVGTFRLTDAIDIFLVTVILYSAIKLIRETRAEQLVKGLMIMFAAWILAVTLQLHMLNSFFNFFFQFGMFAIVVVFQPEIRRALEQLGRSKIANGKNLLMSVTAKDDETLEQRQRKGINAVVDAAASLQKVKMGALIVFEMQTKLGDIVDTGTIVNADPSAPIICNIFFNKAPLHDGAMIMREGMVYAAGCILPLTKNDSVSIELGTRHRAAIGMSENSDAVIVVVSEETGQISVAVNGVLTRNYSRETLKSELEGLILPESTEAGEKRTGKISSIGRAKK